MGKIKLLDCTLRDGGYVNDWKFGYDNILCIFERLIDSKVDIIEIGFLDERRPFDRDRSIMPNTDCMETIYGKRKNENTQIVGMVDYGTCSLKHIRKCSESCLDGIRVIFKKHLMNPAMEYCRQIKALGYKVYAQLVSITDYNDDELMEIIKLVNDVQPYAISIVDTYGLLHFQKLLHYYMILDNNVNLNIKIGFHAHNNLQLAYANTLFFLENQMTHDIIVDGTLYGMGKSAGNAPVELLAMSLNEQYGKNYDIHAMMQCIEENIMQYYYSSPWGYQMQYYLSAKNKCHPNYVKFFEEKENLSISKVDDLLEKISPASEKLRYDKNAAQEIYQKYMEENENDSESKKRLRSELENKKILVVGPGNNIRLQKELIDNYIEWEMPYVISINYIPDDLKTDAVFITNSRRYNCIHITDEKTIATSNVECRHGMFDFVVNLEPLIEKQEKIKDNSYIMFLKLMHDIGIKKLVCAGFDGYSDKDVNYFNPAMEYSFIKQEAGNLNQHIRECVCNFRKVMEIEFLTFSLYDKYKDNSDSFF